MNIRNFLAMKEPTPQKTNLENEGGEVVPEQAETPEEKSPKNSTEIVEQKVPKKVIPKLPAMPAEKKDDHKHEWELIAKTYAAPRLDIKVGEGNFSEEMMERILFGVTSLLWKCLLCSDTKKQEIIGTDENQLDDLLDRVASFGPQHVQKDGQTFIIGKWQPATGGSTLPVR